MKNHSPKKKKKNLTWGLLSESCTSVLILENHPLEIDADVDFAAAAVDVAFLPAGISGSRFESSKPLNDSLEIIQAPILAVADYLHQELK